MAQLRLPYVHEFIDRHGRVRRYFRKNGLRTALPGLVGSPEFMKAYQEALAKSGHRFLSQGQKPALIPTKSIAALIHLYRAGFEYNNLRPATRGTYNRLLKWIESECGFLPATTMPAAAIRSLMGKKKTPSAANRILSLIRILLRHAIDSGWREDNPAVFIRKQRHKSIGFKTWSEDRIKAFEKTHPPHSRERLAFILLLYTGQRRSDVIKMGFGCIHAKKHPDGIVEEKLFVEQSKTGKKLFLPLHPRLQEELKPLNKERKTFLETSQGKAFTAAGFGNWFREACDKAGLKGLSAHGLRKSAARRLAEAGCTPHQIKAITGHSRLEEVALYTEAVDQEKLAEEAFLQMENSKPSGKP